MALHDKNEYGGIMVDLKELLAKHITDEEKLSSVVEELDQNFAKGFIPKGRFNEVNEELKVLKSQMEESKKAMETLSQKASSVEEYEKQLNELKQLNSDIEAKSQQQIASITKKSQLKELLLVNNAHKDALELLVEKYSDVAEVENGSLKDADKLLETIKAEKAGLFVQTKVESVEQGSHKQAPSTDDGSARLRSLYGLK